MGEGYSQKINALIIGSGNFGKYYAHILSQINTNDDPKVPVINNLIITRTEFFSAYQLAERIKKDRNCKVKNEVIPEVAENINHVISLLNKFKPQFIGVTATDKLIGDNIHAEYSLQSLNYGCVLCEKPFCNANGDGASLEPLKKLSIHPNFKQFGLELPFAIVFNNMIKNTLIRDIYHTAKNFEFYWGTIDPIKSNMIDNLILHPWSLFSQKFVPKVVSMFKKEDSAKIDLELYHKKRKTTANCRINLYTGNNFRGVNIDNYSFGFKSKENYIEVFELKNRMQDSKKNGIEKSKKTLLLKVDNPLKQNIISSLGKNPITDIKRTYESQLFLEMLNGYIPPKNFWIAI